MINEENMIPSSESTETRSVTVESEYDTSCEEVERYDDYDTDEEYDAAFADKKAGIKNPVRRLLFGRKYLAFCFLVPLALMALIYVALGVWPVGERSALVLDLNAQYVYYIEKFRSIFTEGGSFLYTFERALGGEFMGIFAYYIASPFNLLTILFPKEWMTEVVLAILLLKCGSCGLTFGIYMHNRFDRRRPVATLIFSCMYALCSFAVVMQNNLMWTDCMILLPIVILGMDSLIKYGKFKLYTLSLALAVFSNFYIGYMMCLFIAFYFFVRYFSMTREERNPRGIKFQFLRTFPKMLLFSLIAVMIAAIVITCAYYSLSFGKLEFSEPDFTPEQLYDFTDILSKFFFGTYDTVRPEGIPFLYAGMLMTLLMPLYFITPGIAPRKKIGAGFMMALFIVSINLSTADLIWHGFQRPNWLNARFTFMFIFLMLIMAYEVFIRIRELGYGKVVVSGAVSVVILLVLQHFNLKHLPDFRAIWASIGIIGIYLAVLRLSHENARRSFVTLSSVFLAVIVCVDLFASGVVDLYAFHDDVTYSKRSSYREFLDSYYDATEYVDELDRGFYREEKLAHRKTNDNFALGIRGISNSTSTLNASIIDLLSDLGFTSRSHWSKYVGGTMLSDSLLGIKYLYIDQWTVNIPDYVKQYYERIYDTEDNILVYKNPYAMSLAFEVSDAINDYSYEEKVGMSGPFEFMNDIFSMTTGIEDLELWKKQTITAVNHESNRKFGVQDNHVGYERYDEDVPATITYEFTASDSNPVYMYIPSLWPREATFTVTGVKQSDTAQDGTDSNIAVTDLNETAQTEAETITKNYVNSKTYFSNDTHSIVEIGTFEAGEKVTVVFTQKDEKVYTLNSLDFFYSFDEEIAMSLSGQFSTNQLDITSFEEDRVEGNITVDKSSANILTTIPYDEGWHVLCDGEEISYTKALDSLMMFKLDEGEHEIVMYYMSDSFKQGASISAIGLGLFILICIGQKFMPILWKLFTEKVKANNKASKVPVAVVSEAYENPPSPTEISDSQCSDTEKAPSPKMDEDVTESSDKTDEIN